MVYPGERDGLEVVTAGIFRRLRAHHSIDFLNKTVPNVSRAAFFAAGKLTWTEGNFFNANYRILVSWKMQEVIVHTENMKHGLAQACDHFLLAFVLASGCMH